MEETEIYQRFRNFIFLALQSAVPENMRLPKNKIIIANQSDTRPKKPFITVQLSSFKEIGDAISRKYNPREGGAVEEIQLSRTCTCEISVFADALQEAENILNHVYKLLFTNLVKDIFVSEIGLRRILKTVTALPAAVNEQIESRAYLELELGYVTIVLNNIYNIEHIQMQINEQEFIYPEEV
jgi:hypothetical protein